MSRKRGGKRHRKQSPGLPKPVLLIRVRPEDKVKYITSCSQGLTWELIAAKLGKDGIVSATYKRTSR